jgi:two-component system, LytTR family, response regulator
MNENSIVYKQVIEIKTSNGLKIICLKNVLFIEAARKCSIIYFDDKSSIVAYHMLKWFDNYLFKPCFFRCHNSYIINCCFVDFYNNKGIILKDKQEIPLSRNKVKSFKGNLKDLQVNLVYEIN